MTVEPNLEEARRFLRALDPRPGAAFHCQTYADEKAKNDLSLARVVVVALGAPDETLQLNRLASLNRRGAGVFVTPSDLLAKSDESGKPLRRREQYVRARAVVADDCGPECFQLRPSLVVRTSADKLQAYWLLDLDEPPLEEDRFKAIVLAATARSAGDPQCRPTLEHVFRLPGFHHQKDPANPFRSRVELAGDERWKVADLERLFPPSGAQTRASGPSDVDRGAVPRQLLAACLDALDPKDFDQRDLWFPLMCACHHATDGSGADEWLSWLGRRDPNFKRYSRDAFLQWRSLDGRSGKQITSASLAFYLRQLGTTAGDDLSDRVLFEEATRGLIDAPGEAPGWLADELDPAVRARRILAATRLDQF